jgi:hypothetical protein
MIILHLSDGRAPRAGRGTPIGTYVAGVGMATRPIEDVREGDQVAVGREPTGDWVGEYRPKFLAVLVVREVASDGN